MIRSLALVLLLSLAACTNPLELGERRYREGDRVAALEIWRSVDREGLYYESVQQRIQEVENESARLAAQFKKRGSYYEGKGRLAESVLNYRLALQLRPDDRATLNHVQTLVRSLAARVDEARSDYAEAFEAGDLIGARSHLAALRTLDPLDPRLASDERRLEETLQSRVEPLLARGRRAFSSGDYRSAQRAFDQVLELDPENETARGNLSFIAQIREVEKAAAGTPSQDVEPPQIHATDEEIQAEGLFQNALRAERDGDLFKAIEFDTRALLTDPGHPHARAHLAELRGKLPSAEDLIRQGRESFQREDLEAALEQWRNALLIDPGNAQALEYVSRAEGLLANLERLRAGPDVELERR